MKLHELGAQRPTQQIARVIEGQLGRDFDIDRVPARRLPTLLHRVQGILAEHRQGPQWHTSERDGAYLNLVMMERAIRARITELDTPMAIDVNSPETKQTLRKAETGQNLTRDEQNTITAMALMKKESRKNPRRLREQSELQTAQVVLASQDMIDRIQGMLEDISEMQFKDLPALTDSIKQDIGMDQATQFQTQASQALTTLLGAVQAGKVEMEAAQGTLTGQQITVPGQPAPAQPGMNMEPGMAQPDMMGAVPAAEEPAVEPEPTDNAALGRERR